jgi:exopolysaccharide production protein ExoQ
VLVLWGLDSTLDLKAAFVERLGRDMTFTTRTDIWASLIGQAANPLLGAGFNTFWSGSRLVELTASLGGIVQAHNGYLETYLNGGLVGCGLLFALLASSYYRIRQAFVLGAPLANIRLVLLLVAVIYNWSEASFNKLGLLWFVTLVALVECNTRSRGGPALQERQALSSKAGVGHA